MILCDKVAHKLYTKSHKAFLMKMVSIFNFFIPSLCTILMRIGILTGTRPDIIKMAPLYWEAEKRGHAPVLVHTGQHYSRHLFSGTYESMCLPEPLHALEVGKCGSPAETVGKIILATDKLLRAEEKNMDILLVHGDTMTSMAGALAAYLNLVPVGHVEAGLRTFSREPFPEQLDTRCSDAASDLFFAPTERNVNNLINEGFPKERIFLTGNTVVDAAIWAAKRGEGGRELFSSLGLDFSKPLVYYSIHRRETTMNKDRFIAAAKAAIGLAGKGYSVAWSVRPGTASAIREYSLGGMLNKNPNLHLIEEIPSYPHIMFLMSRCRFVCTDSGSMQEEAAALHVPCVTVRFVTDRPESVEAGINRLAAPTCKDNILKVCDSVERDNSKMRKNKNPYGGGNSSKLILDAIENFEGKMIAWEHHKKHNSI